MSATGLNVRHKVVLRFSHAMMATGELQRSSNCPASGAFSKFLKSFETSLKFVSHLRSIIQKRAKTIELNTVTIPGNSRLTSC